MSNLTSQSKIFTGWGNAITTLVEFADALIGLIPGVKLPSDNLDLQHNVAEKVNENIISIVQPEEKELYLSGHKVEYTSFSSVGKALYIQTRSSKKSTYKTNALSRPDFFKLSTNKDDFCQRTTVL